MPLLYSIYTMFTVLLSLTHHGTATVNVHLVHLTNVQGAAKKKTPKVFSLFYQQLFGILF